MEPDRACDFILSPEERPKGSPSKRSTRRYEWNLVDITNRRTLERSAQWYPPYQTCHRRFQQWVRQGVFERIVKELAEDLYERGGIDIRETFIDGSFSPAKKGVVLSAIRNAGKAPRSWQLQTLLVFLSPLISKAPLPMK